MSSQMLSQMEFGPFLYRSGQKQVVKMTCLLYSQSSSKWDYLPSTRKSSEAQKLNGLYNVHLYVQNNGQMTGVGWVQRRSKPLEERKIEHVSTDLTIARNQEKDFGTFHHYS